MRIFLAFLATAALLFSGCAGTTDETTSSTSRTSTLTSTGTSDGTSSSTNAPTTSATTSGGTNRAPTVLSIVASPSAGGAPLAVNFSFDASDPDGTALSWTLAFGDGSTDASGTTLPGAQNHTYTAVGNYTAKLTVTDGDATAEQELDIEVTGGGSSGGSYPISATLTAAIWCEACTGAGDTVDACASWNAQNPGIDCNWLELPADAAGHPWTLVSTDGSGVLGANSQAAFMDGCAAGAAQLAWVDEADTPEESGTVPAGALCMVVLDFYGAELTFDVEIA